MVFMNDCEKYANACKTCRVATGQEVVSEKYIYNFKLVMTREKSLIKIVFWSQAKSTF